MASLAQKLGHLMLHNASDWDQSIAFRNPTSSRIDKIPVPQATWVFNNASATNVSTNSAQGVATGRSTSFNGKSYSLTTVLVSRCEYK